MQALYTFIIRYPGQDWEPEEWSVVLLDSHEKQHAVGALQNTFGQNIKYKLISSSINIIVVHNKEENKKSTTPTE